VVIHTLLLHMTVSSLLEATTGARTSVATHRDMCVKVSVICLFTLTCMSWLVA